MPSPNRVVRPWEARKPPTDRPYVTAPTNQGRMNPNRKIYGSQRWRVISLRYLANNPLCVHCKEQGKLVEATQTDHITPINQGGDPWDEGNYQALCRRCHDKKSAKERHQSQPTNKPSKN